MALNVEMIRSISVIHAFAMIGMFAIKNISIYTVILQAVWYVLSMIGITAGYHRLWTHRTYDASTSLQWFLMLCGTSACQKDAIWWAKSHRTHHRNEDKLSDPYSINRGVFYAHIGWLLQMPDELTQSEIDKSDVSDLEGNEILQFQEKYYTRLIVIGSIGLPVIIASIWNDSYNCFWACFVRIVLGLHATYCVNSLAHIGSDTDTNKPYDKSIQAVENRFVSFITLGEGWHNYHHAFPKDFRASEKNKYNPTAWFIQLTKALGLSTNLYERCESIKLNRSNKFDKRNYVVL